MKISTLTIEMAANVARLRQDMDKAQRTVDRAMGNIGKTVDKLKSTIGTLFAGLSVGAAIGKLVTVQREFDVLNSSLITVTGSSAAADREFAWIKQFAATTPYQLNEVTGAFVKMKALGLDASRESLASYGNTASAMGKGLNQMIEAVADAATGEFERLKEFGIKSKSEGDRVTFTFRGVSTQVGKNAAEITQYLRAIGETDFAGAMELRARTLDGALSNLADTWDELFRTVNTNSTGSVIYDTVTLASGALRDAVTIMEALTGATQKNAQATGAMSTIQSGLATIFETVAVLGVNLRFVLVGIGREIGGIAAQAGAVLTGNFAQAAEIGRQMRADAQAARQEVDAQTKAILNARREAARIQGAGGLDEPRFRSLLNPQSAAAAAAATDCNTTSTKALAAASREAAKALREQEQAAKALADIRVKTQQLTDQAADAYFNSAQAVADANTALREEIALIGLDETARAALLRIKEAELLADKESHLIALQNAGADAVTISALEREIALRQQRLGLLDDKSAAEAAQATKEAQEQLRTSELAAWQRTNDQIAQSFTDALMAGGKSVADYLKGLFRTLVLRPVLEPIARGAAGLVSGLFGGGAGSVGGIASSMLGNGGLGGLASGFGQAFSSGLGALFSGNGVGAFSNGLSLIGTGTLTNIASGLGTALGTALPVAALVGGVVGMFSKKIKEQGFGVNLSGNQAAGAFDYTRRGNAFGSSTTRTATTDPAAMAFAMQAQAVAQASQDMAGALGMGSQALAAYTGEVRVNLRGAEDAAEVQRRMTEALDELQYKMLAGVDGFDMTRQAFGQMMEGVRASIDAAGISTQGISDVLLNGMMQGLGSEQTGAQLADVIVGGIYRSIAQQYTQQIASMFMAQIVTPIFTAMAAGVPISQAISQASINSMVQSAQQAAEALNAIFSNAEFQEAMGMIGESIAGVTASFGGIHIPDFSAGIVAHNEAAAEAERIASERAGLETELLNLLGNTTELRRRELEAIDASNRALKQQIWALEDARSAMDGAFEDLERATAAELERIDAQLSQAADLERDLGSVFALLRENIRSLRGEVETTALMQASAARALIAQATAGGALPEQDALRDAIDAARAGVESARYRSAAERDYARLVLANELQALQGVVQPRLSAAEQTVVALEAQQTVLEDQLKTQSELLDAQLGQNTALLSVADALSRFTASLAAYSGVFTAAGGQKFATGAAFAGGVVTRPTRFNRDEMGEVGPEGILPLANVGGRLGVHAQTGSDPELKALVREMIRKLDALATSSETGAVAFTRLDDRVRKLIREDQLMVGVPQGKTLATKEAA